MQHQPAVSTTVSHTTVSPYFKLQIQTKKYTSHVIQNEIMSIMAMQNLKKMCREIKENVPYTIKADECTEVANTAIYALYSVSVRRYELL